jgi:hypothetical protein
MALITLSRNALLSISAKGKPNFLPSTPRYGSIRLISSSVPNAFEMRKAIQIHEDGLTPSESSLPSYCNSHNSVARWLESLPYERETLATIEGPVDENTNPSSNGGAKKITEGEGRVKKRQILGRLEINGMDVSEERKRRRSPRKQLPRPSTHSDNTDPPELATQAHTWRASTPDNPRHFHLDGAGDEATPRSNHSQALGLSQAAFTALEQTFDLTRIRS